MNKYSFLLVLGILITLTVIAQSQVQSGSASAKAGETNSISEPIMLETPTATLYGTLALPHSTAPVPVVLIIAGSGPTDRDGNSPLLRGPNNSLKMLAEGLAAHGIASVRYDKRGIGETGKAMQLAAEKAKTVLREEDFNFETYIDDAVLWGKKLLSDRRFSTVTVLGHSEGSLIGMVAAQRIGVHAYVSIAGAGRPIQQIILEQVKPQLSPDLLKATEDILNQLAAGKTVAAVPPELNALFRPSVQPYMISWLRYDPAKEIAKLHIPILVVQGNTDIQATLGDARTLAVANPAATLLMIEGMNHVLKLVPNEQDKQISSYSDPKLPLAPVLINELSRFVLETKGPRPSRVKL